MSKNKPLSFEQSLEQLEQLVNRMDSGDLPLEASLEAFEQGIQLVRQCQQQLQQAEQKVQQLMQTGDALSLQPLQNEAPRSQASSDTPNNDDLPF